MVGRLWGHPVSLYWQSLLATCHPPTTWGTLRPVREFLGTAMRKPIPEEKTYFPTAVIRLGASLWIRILVWLMFGSKEFRMFLFPYFALHFFRRVRVYSGRNLPGVTLFFLSFLHP